MYPLDGWQVGSGRIDFVIPQYNNMLIESDSFHVVMESHVESAQSDKPLDDMKHAYAPVNAVGSTFISSTMVQIGDEFICGDNKYDVYKNYLNLLLGYSKEAKESWMKYTMLYQEDDPGQL